MKLKEKVVMEFRHYNGKRYTEEVYKYELEDSSYFFDLKEKTFRYYPEKIVEKFQEETLGRIERRSVQFNPKDFTPNKESSYAGPYFEGEIKNYFTFSGVKIVRNEITTLNVESHRSYYDKRSDTVESTPYTEEVEGWEVDFDLFLQKIGGGVRCSRASIKSIKKMDEKELIDYINNLLFTRTSDKEEEE